MQNRKNLLHRILAATDGSEGAGRAVEVAARLAADFDLDLRILHVMDGDDKVLTDFSREEGISRGDACTAVANGILINARERAQKMGAKKISLELRQGYSAEEILAEARAMGADAIFAGRRGRGRLAELLLGSVAQKLVSLAPCMVAVVP